MTDCELLEAAARAAGYVPVRWTDDGTALLLYGVQEPWNALDENPHSDCMGDAFRLAAELEMAIEFMGGRVVVWTDSNYQGKDSGDILADARREIVRAAAMGIRDDWTGADLAAMAYEAADAMIAARSVKGGE